MMCLEPIRFERKQMMYDELDEFNEVIILMEGMVNIGYRINGIPSIAYRHYRGIIGDYFITFNKRSMFIY